MTLNIIPFPTRRCECGKPSTGRLMGANSPLGCDDCRAAWERDLALADYATAARRLYELGVTPPTAEEVLR